MDIDNVIQKKKKNEKKGILIEFCSFFLHTTKSAKNTSFFAKWKYKHQRNKEHTCLIFLIEKVKAHTPTFIVFVKLCKKPIYFFFFLFFLKKKRKKDNINSVPRGRKLVIKTQQWHILYIVLSPLTLYWVLQGDKKHRKSSCTNNNTNKAKVCMHHFYTTYPNQALPNTFAKLELQMWTKQILIKGAARPVYNGKESKQTQRQKKKGCIPWEKKNVFLVEKNQGTA